MTERSHVRVLLLEDSTTDALLIRDALDTMPELSADLVHAETLEEGMENGRLSYIDVVLLDLGLPDSNGMETFRTFHNACPDLPVLVLTGLDDLQISMASIREGAQDYLIKKNIGAELLGRAIRYAMERNLLNREVSDSRDSLRKLTQRMENVREEERVRISREVHDGLGQKLTALKLDLGWLERHIPQAISECSPEILYGRIREASDLIRRIMGNVQKIAIELRPSALDHLGLCDAIRDESRRVSNRSGLKVELDMDEIPPLLEPKLATAFFRIFQELMTNVVRHAQATEVRVALKQEAETLVLSVRDDGVGIPPEKMNLNTSLGLLGMRERAEAYHGVIEFRSAVGKGTLVTVSIPQNIH